jgi:flagellar protein FlbD
MRKELRNMIALHRLTHPDAALYINPDQIQLIEGTPDTVITLTNGSKFVVGERPEEVTGLIRSWRASILAEVLPPARNLQLAR